MKAHNGQSRTNTILEYVGPGRGSQMTHNSLNEIEQIPWDMSANASTVNEQAAEHRHRSADATRIYSANSWSEGL